MEAAFSASFVPPAFDCAPAPGTPVREDQHFHGTHVASTAANNVFMAGVGGSAKLRAVKVLNCAGSGAFSWVIGGILYAADTGNDIINMSLGPYFPKNLPGAGDLVSDLNAAVNYAHSQGVLVVSAAGNSAIDPDQEEVCCILAAINCLRSARLRECSLGAWRRRSEPCASC